MVNAAQLLRSAMGLTKFLMTQLLGALRCFLTGKGEEGTELIRLALQGLHDDVATIIASRYRDAPPLLPNEVARILIVKLDRLGDMVNTTPVFEFLRHRYPLAQLDIVGHPAVLKLLENDSRLNARFSYKSSLYHKSSLRPPGFVAWRLVRELRKARYPLVVYLRGSIPFLVLGFQSRFVATKFVEGEPVIRRYLRPLGASLVPTDPIPVPTLHVSSASFARVSVKHPQLAQGGYVVVHAVSAAVGKQWPLERFARIADWMADRLEATILFLATPAEEHKMSQIKSLCVRSHVFETGCSLSEVVSAIANADVFLGNDSGLAHIAAGVGTREVVIWGGANREMAQPATAAGFCTVLYRDVPCRQVCPEVRCCGPRHIACLMDITESAVTDAVYAQVRAARATRH